MAVPLPFYYYIYWFSLILLPLSLLNTNGVFSFIDDPSPPPSPETQHQQQQQQLLYDFYRFTCPNAESIVFQTMRNAIAVDSKVTAQFLRLMFHDCFIQGCDASLLLDDRNGNQNHSTERDAVPNHTLKGFQLIDKIKEALERECPGVVSCSDIISVATRDAIILSGGPFFPILTGRRDSLQSYFNDASQLIPKPDGDITQTLHLFSQRGFNAKETVSLLGAHNIGKIGCEFIQQRLTNFQSTGHRDPSIATDLLVELQTACNLYSPPPLSPSPSTQVRTLMESSSPDPFVFSGSVFDTHYYKNLMMGRGLLYSDQQLLADPTTARLVEVFASDDGSTFRREFAKSMLKMSNLGALTGSHGEIRMRCSFPNSH